MAVAIVGKQVTLDTTPPPPPRLRVPPPPPPPPSPPDLDTLEGWAVECFGGVPARRRVKRAATNVTDGGAVAGGAAGGAAAGAGAAAAADEEVNLTASGKAAWEGVFPSTPRAVLMKPSRTMEEVAVFWSLPGIESKTETLPGQLLGYLLGQESKGSLTAELVKRGWATGLSAVRMPSVEPARLTAHTHRHPRPDAPLLPLQGMDEDVAALSIMGVQISLTKKGVAHWEEVLEVLYAQIALLKAADLSAAAADARASDALGFRYSPKAAASDEASSLASSLRLCASEPERLLACRRVATAFDAPLTARLLDLLTPDRMVVLLKSTTLAANVTGNSTGDATEPHYGTLHRPLDLPPALLARLAAPPAVASLTLPAANALLPDSFTLLSGAPPGRHEPPALADGATPTRRLWHLADTTYKLPTAEVRVRWAVPEVGASAEGGVMASLLSSILAEQRRSDRYDAERAGISADVSPSTFGFEVDASGFSQRLPEAVRRAVAAVTRCKSRTTSSPSPRRSTRARSRRRSPSNPPSERRSSPRRCWPRWRTCPPSARPPSRT